MIEAEVHQQLYAFLKHQGEIQWPHHLTIARLVARALRLNRDAILQISPLANYQGRYRLSYLAALLLSPQAAILVASEAVQARLLHSDIPRFRDWCSSSKPIYRGQDWPGNETPGLLLLTPQEWLCDQWQDSPQYPHGWPLIIDQADELENWAREALTVTLAAQSWDQLMWAYPEKRDLIRDVRATLIQQIFKHPVNPYEAIAIDETKLLLFQRLQTELSYHSPQQSPSHWQQFWAGLTAQNHHHWIEIDRNQGQFQAKTAPTHLFQQLTPLLAKQPTVLIGSSFGLEPDGLKYRQALQMEEATYVQFAADRQGEVIQLHLPDRIPMPNTKEFQGVLLQQLQSVLLQQGHPMSPSLAQPMVIIVDDMPLKSQVAAHLAALMGSRVVVESTDIAPQGILITGWQFWLQHQAQLPAPQGLLIATLPIPSPENPKVAARIEQYKRQRLDWFRLYLLPSAIQTLQKAIAPIRSQDTLVAIYDNRILHRSYGQQILAALSPYARIESPEFPPADSMVQPA